MSQPLDNDQDPLDLARRVGGGLLLIATLIALVAWLALADSRLLRLVSACWALYGAYYAFLDGLLEPLIDGVAGFFQGVGLMRAGGGYSDIETLVAQGNILAAAEAYDVRARAGQGDTTALLRRAALLAGPLECPGTAALELETERHRRTLPPADDLKLGAALVSIHERLDEPGKAMTELRRLIDRYPGARNIRLLRRELADLKEMKFGEHLEERK